MLVGSALYARGGAGVQLELSRHSASVLINWRTNVSATDCPSPSMLAATGKPAVVFIASSASLEDSPIVNIPAVKF